GAGDAFFTGAFFSAAGLAAAGFLAAGAAALAGAALEVVLEVFAAGLDATFSLDSEAFLLAEVFLGEEEDGSPDLDIS
ncbi:hypothetical protein, partial [Akkermansia sp.]|uniref:hypothetical protein n=1 Tax=Akkermansia sp. TaxID=1872421 RepID=UPI003AEF3B2A